MSRLLELKDQLKQKSLEYFEKFKETELYQKADEKYNSLTPHGQKIARYGIALFLFFILVFYPISQLEFSKTMVAEFEVKRELLRDLFKTYRTSSLTISLPQPPAEGELVSQIQSTLASAQLLPEQIVAVAPVEPEGQFIPKKLLSSAISVQLANLNLKQAVDIGTQLANLSGSIKVKDLFMSASTEKAGYFDVTYKVYAFNVPQPIVQAAPDIEPPIKNKKKPPSDTDESTSKNSEITE